MRRPNRKTDLQVVVTPAWTNAWWPLKRLRIELPEGATNNRLRASHVAAAAACAGATLCRAFWWSDICIAQRLLTSGPGLSRLLIRQGQARRPATAWKPSLRQTAPCEPTRRVISNSSPTSFHLKPDGFGLCRFVVGLFIVNSAIGLAFEHSFRCCCGPSRLSGYVGTHAERVLLVELVSLALIAGSWGLVLRLLIAASLLPDVVASLRGPLWRQIPVIELSVMLIAGLIISVVGALAARPQVLRKEKKTICSVLVARSPTPGNMRTPWFIFQSALALAVLVCRGCLLWSGIRFVSGLPCSRLAACAATCPACDPGRMLSLGQRRARARSPSGSGRAAASSFPDCRWP